MSDIDDRIAVAICQSGKIETGHGTCAFLCMDQLGDARKRPCAHALAVHAALVDAIVKAIAP